jgi:galactose-1-phosphate uridylyltransferase
LIPKEHKPNFGFINEMEIGDFAKILKATLVGYNTLFSRPDRNFWIHTMRYEPYQWHVGFLPHIKTLGGLEMGAGIWVSDRATPEDAACEMGPIVKKSFEE